MPVVSRGTRGDADAASRRSSRDRKYFNFTGYPFPLGPITERQTIRREVVKGSIWLFEQPQSLGFSNVTTNVRMTVIKLASGGLWVHAPVAPTAECIRLVKDLGAPVEHIVLPTFAYEHKIFVGPFSRKFPRAKVWIAPRQWSWPINLPPQFFGIFPTGGTLLDGDIDTPWADEIEQKVLVTSVGIGPYIEAAFFHKRSRSLIVTDAVVSVPLKPPEVVRDEDVLSAAASNFFIRVLAGERAKDPVGGVPLAPTELTPAVRDLGWRRMALQILYIVPGDLRDPTRGFLAVANRLIVGPILKTLVFSTEPAVSRAWVDSICNDWDFTSVIPAHFSAPVRGTPADLRGAFGFLYGGANAAAAAKPAAAEASGGDDNPAQLLDGWLTRALGGGGKHRGGGAAARPAARGVEYPEDDIRALNAARAFLVKAGVVNK